MQRFIKLDRDQLPFFARYLECVHWVSGMPFDELALNTHKELSEKIKNPDEDSLLLGTSSSLYWGAFVLGSSAYLNKTGTFAENIYVKYSVKLLSKLNFDPELTSLINDSKMFEEKFILRFETMRNMLTDKAWDPLPIIIFTKINSNNPQITLESLEGQKIICTDLDGYHRLFSALITDRKRIPFFCAD